MDSTNYCLEFARLSPTRMEFELHGCVMAKIVRDVTYCWCFPPHQRMSLEWVGQGSYDGAIHVVV